MKLVKLAGPTGENQKETQYWTGKGGYDELEPGSFVEGIYKNKHVREGEYGPSSTYYIEGDEITIGVNGKTVLDRLMSQVPLNSFVRIEYKGLGVKAKGKKPPFLFDVFIEEAAASKVLAE